MVYLLHHLISHSARRNPDQIAVKAGNATLTYRELDETTGQLAAVLRAHGVRRGDRVGICVRKSLASVVSVFAVLKAGGCYVPLDPLAPAQRNSLIIRDCQMRLLLLDAEQVGQLPHLTGTDSPLSEVICLHRLLHSGQAASAPDAADAGTRSAAVRVSWFDPDAAATQPAPPLDDEAIETDTAYILYTSGSTGTPKGVMISHRNSLTFVNWAADYVGLREDDRVSSHAPLHFDLSIFDIFATCQVGGTIILIPEGAATVPVHLTQLIEREAITVWYSVPSVLTLLVLYGNLGAYDLSHLRTVIFAGEVFPIKYLSQLMALLPRVRFHNWYGPTETNVCTSYDVSPLAPERTAPVPIGKACRNMEVLALNQQLERVTTPGEEGEIYVRGPAVMQGYWGDPEKTARTLVPNPLQPHYREMIYRTGDIVTLDADGNYLYLGRSDGMVKTRGYRVELGEIEAALYSHPDVREAAVIPVSDSVFGNLLRAIVSLNTGAAVGIEELQAYCRSRLPSYMVPEAIEVRGEALPKTSTGKTDRTLLRQQLVLRT